MKLLFVGTNHGGGGTESHFITLAKAMCDAGHTVTAVVLPNSPIHLGLQNSRVSLLFGKFRNAFDPRGFRAVWRAISSFEPDWIIGSYSKEYWPLAIIAKLRGTKLALFKHMDFPLRPATHHFIPRMADRFIVISKFMRHKFIHRGIAPEHIQMLYNPLDLDYFRPDLQLRNISRNELGIGDDDIVIGFVGAMHLDKGILVLAEAINLCIAELPNLKAFWIGEGPASQELSAYLKHSGYAAHHHCFPWAKDVRPYYAAMDLLAVPTQVTETFGRVSIEAQACGVPVLCSDLGGLPETLRPEITGKLIPVGDVLVWRDAILELAKDTTLRMQLRSKAQEWIDSQFSAPAIAREFTRLLESQNT